MGTNTIYAATISRKKKRNHEFEGELRRGTFWLWREEREEKC